MWPGQQQPGGEQNPQQPNPYQQPGYQQPNPYQQQPGFGQQPGGDPNAYQQPPGQWGAPTYPGGPQGPQGPQGGNGKSKKTAIIAIAAALVVVAGSVVTGAVLLQDDDEGDKNDKASEKQESGGDEKSTGGGASGGEKKKKDPTDPTIDGWQTATNSKYYASFDVPADWKVESSKSYGWGEKDDELGLPEVSLTGPAIYKQGWCSEESTMAVTGIKGAQGAKDTKEATEPQADSFAYFAFGEQKNAVERAKAKPFKNKHGIKGHIATSKAVDVKKKEKCDTDGQVVAVSWINANDDLATFVAVAPTGEKDAVSHKTLLKIASTIRTTGDPDEDSGPRG